MKCSRRFARLAALAALQSGNDGQYTSPAPAADFEPHVVTQVVSSRHENAFREWLNLGLETQHAQICEFLASPPEHIPSTVLEAPTPLIPTSASLAERTLFLDDLKLVVSLIERG